MSDSSRPRGLQPSRLLCPWDFPGKSTGVGCHAFSGPRCYEGAIGQTHRGLSMDNQINRKGHFENKMVYDGIDYWKSRVRACSVTQSSPTLRDPVDCSLPGSSVHGIFQARVLEWVAISFSRGSKPGLPHCRQTLYCLSHQGSPMQAHA